VELTEGLDLRFQASQNTESETKVRRIIRYEEVQFEYTHLRTTLLAA
jgi:hypothetical protein